MKNEAEVRLRLLEYKRLKADALKLLGETGNIVHLKAHDDFDIEVKLLLWILCEKESPDVEQ